DRELALTGATAVRDRLAELEATLATATRKQDGGGKGQGALPGAEIARLSQEHARLLERWSTCVMAQGELRTAEELCLEALAQDIDAIDLIDAAVLQRQRFRRDLFWLLTAMRPVKPGAMLLVHSPDARAAVKAACRVVLEAAAHHGWRGSVHVWNEHAPGWKPSLMPGGGWGPPHDLAWLVESGTRVPPATLVRVHGGGADLLLGLEAGLHRFHGLAGEACHAWVDLLEPRCELTEAEWSALPGPPSPRTARGSPMREVFVDSDRTTVDGDELDVPWRELGDRLAEAAVVRLLGALAKPDAIDALWKWEHPLPVVGSAEAKP
nr:hypothetical protein [Myxococcota bacterium]